MSYSHDQIIAAIRDLNRRTEAIEAKSHSKQVVDNTSQASTTSSNGMFTEIIKGLQATSAMVVVFMIVWLISLIPQAGKMIKEFIHSLPPSASKSMMSSTISITSEQGKPALTLSHAVMFRIPALPDSTESQAKYERLHKILREYGGWNRWKIDRQSDKPSSGDSTEEKYMYSLALIPAHATEAPSRISRELGELFGNDKLIMTYSLSDANLVDAIAPSAK